jgi:hypothetical protein
MRIEHYVTLAAITILLPLGVVAQRASRPVDTNDAALVPPAPPPSRSPVDFFRELLAMTPAQRYSALSNRPPENQKMIMAKVREYLSLAVDDRELRLRATELHWRMLPLMRLPATNRTARLTLIPEPDRWMIESRLKDWDKLSAPVQQQLLTNQEAIRMFIQREAGTNASGDVVNLSPKRREMLEDGIVKIKSMKPDDRRHLLDRFNQFFELTRDEKQKALNSLTEQERAKIDKTLSKFQNLSADQRARCIQSFEKFSSMTLAERQQFLKNAERWNAMKPEERKTWRDLVEQIELMPPESADPLKGLRPPGVRSNGGVVRAGATN